MLYLITEQEDDFGYFRLYNTALRKYLNNHNIEYIEVVVNQDYYCIDNIKKIDSIHSNFNDIWLVSYAQNPLMNLIFKKPGKKFGHIHGLEANKYEPAVLHGYNLNEEILLYYYDGLFVNSEYAYSIIKDSYPGIATKTVISGFPFDIGFTEKFKNLKKHNNIICFNQRFDIDKLHILEVYISEKLIESGFKVVHLCSPKEFARIQSDRESRTLLFEMQKLGVYLIISATRMDYYKNLARTRATITTSIADTLSLCMLEAAALGSTPIAPNMGPFPEYMKLENLYKPYNIDDLLNKVINCKNSQVDLYKFTPDKVFDIYMKSMGVN